MLNGHSGVAFKRDLHSGQVRVEERRHGRHRRPTAVQPVAQRFLSRGELVRVFLQLGGVVGGTHVQRGLADSTPNLFHSEEHETGGNGDLAVLLRGDAFPFDRDQRHLAERAVLFLGCTTGHAFHYFLNYVQSRILCISLRNDGGVLYVHVRQNSRKRSEGKNEHYSRSGNLRDIIFRMPCPSGDSQHALVVNSHKLAFDDHFQYRHRVPRRQYLCEPRSLYATV